MSIIFWLTRWSTTSGEKFMLPNCNQSNIRILWTYVFVVGWGVSVNFSRENGRSSLILIFDFFTSTSFRPWLSILWKMNCVSVQLVWNCTLHTKAFYLSSMPNTYFLVSDPIYVFFWITHSLAERCNCITSSAIAIRCRRLSSVCLWCKCILWQNGWN